MSKLSHFVEQLKNKLIKPKKLTDAEKQARMDKIHQAFFNSEEYVIASTIFHYRNSESHELKIIINST